MLEMRATSNRGRAYQVRYDDLARSNLARRAGRIRHLDSGPLGALANTADDGSLGTTTTDGTSVHGENLVEGAIKDGSHL